MGGLAGRVREYVRLNGISYTARRAVEKFRDQYLRTWNSSAIGPGRKRR